LPETKAFQHTTDNASKLIRVCSKRVSRYIEEHIAIINAGQRRTAMRKVVTEEMFMATDGLGGVDLICLIQTIYRLISAIDFILGLSVKTYPGEVEIISVGPMTNLALAIDQDEDDDA
jgi:purine nucleosidase